MEQGREGTGSIKLLSDKMIEYLYDTQEGLRKDYGEEYYAVGEQYLFRSHDLQKDMTEEQKALFRQVEDLATDMHAREDVQTFIRGFRLGVKFVLEIM